MKIDTKASGKRTGIILSGELTVRHAAQLKQVLEECLNSSEAVGIEIVNVLDADLSFLQLLCAAGRMARKAGKDVNIDGQVPDIVLELIARAGFENHGSMSGHRCIWSDEKHGDGS